MIPKHLHFLWGFLGDGFPLAGRQAHSRDLWCGFHPDWQVDVHGPLDLESIIPASSRASYERLQTGIQRCDFIRPFLLRHYGGVYSDLDVQPLQTLDLLSEQYANANGLLVEEVTLSRGSSIRHGKRHAIRQGQPEVRLRVANFWMASSAGHPFWDHVIELIEARSHMPILEEYDVIYTTGPDVMSEVYDRFGHLYEDVELVPRRHARKFFRHKGHGGWRG